MLNRIFVHWKTTVGGMSLTAILTFVSVTYKPGMSWKSWSLIAIPAVIGVLAKDPGKTN